MVKIQICAGTCCHRNGAYNVIASFQHLIEDHRLNGDISLEAVFCMQKCAREGVALSVNGQVYHVRAEEARSFFRQTILPLVRQPV